jgi:hypothetical protein
MNGNSPAVHGSATSAWHLFNFSVMTETSTRPVIPLRSLLLLVGAAAVVSGLTGTMAARWAWSSRGGAAADKTGAVSSSDTIKGPWGELRKVRMITEKPLEFINVETATAERNLWNFGPTDAGAIRKALAAAGVAPAVIDPLLATAKTVDGQLLAEPEDDLILGLSGSDRTAVHRLLRNAGITHLSVFPFCFPAGRLPRLLSDHVRPATASLLLPMVYRVGKADCFSDLAPVLRALPDASERRALIRAMTQQETLLLEAVVRPDTEIEAMINYWGSPGRERNLRSLLESLSEVPGGSVVDAVYLLPPFVRERLYTYPEGPLPGGRDYDCHWTSLNFFRSEPDMSFLNPPAVAEALAKDYETIPAPAKPGDIVLYTVNGKQVVHSCVYIADDVVFTKNGANPMQPWVFMSMAELETVYPAEEPYTVLFYRKRPGM